MTTAQELSMRRELLLLKLQAQRQVCAQSPLLAVEHQSVQARSATMRFILRRPQLCWWALSELLPLALSLLPGKTGKRFARAFNADRDC